MQSWHADTLKREKEEYEYQRAAEAQERIKRMMFSMMEKDGGSDG